MDDYGQNSDFKLRGDQLDRVINQRRFIKLDDNQIIPQQDIYELNLYMINALYLSVYPNINI